jgi:predicted DNA binding protein
MACQTLFWERARRSSAMVDLTEEEQSALRHAMKMAAEIMEEIGWNTRLSDLTEQQVLTLMEAAVGGFQDAMREIAAANRQSPEVPF